MAERILKRLALRALVLFARLTDRWRRSRIPVFLYHSIDAAGSPVSIHPERFTSHWDYLRRRGFRPIALCQAADLARSRRAFPARSVVLTFDDGYRNNAAPIRAILQAGGRATLFPTAGRMGGYNEWDAVRGDIPTLPLLPPEAVADLARMGCEIGAHGLTHAALDALSADALSAEVAGSCRRLTALVGRPVTSFAYPYGCYHERALDAIREAGIQAACTTLRGYLTARTPLLEIPRFSAAGLDPLLYRLAAHRGYHWYAGLQRCLNRATRRVDI